MKRVVMILACLCLMCSAAFAEETETIVLNWDDITEEVKAQGEFHQKEIPGECTVSFWIPSVMESVEVGSMTTYRGADPEHYLVVDLTTMAVTMEESIGILEAAGLGSDFRNVTINGVDCITYEVPNRNLKMLTYPVKDNNYLKISYPSLSGDEEWAATINTIFSSIQKEE